MLKHRRSR